MVYAFLSDASNLQTLTSTFAYPAKMVGNLMGKVIQLGSFIDNGKYEAAVKLISTLAIFSIPFRLMKIALGYFCTGTADWAISMKQWGWSSWLLYQAENQTVGNIFPSLTAVRNDDVNEYVDVLLKSASVLSLGSTIYSMFLFFVRTQPNTVKKQLLEEYVDLEDVDELSGLLNSQTVSEPFVSLEAMNLKRISSRLTDLTPVI